MLRKDSSEYGWITISRTSYERMLRDDYAGPGTPTDPSAPGAWVLSLENDGATVLFTGVEVVED